MKIADQLARSGQLKDAAALLAQIGADLPDSLLVFQRLRYLYEQLGDQPELRRVEASIARIRAARGVPSAPAVAAGDLVGPLVVVDPIFRGSRLYYSAMLVEALSPTTDRKIRLWTRQHIESDLLASYRDRLAHVDIDPSLRVREDLWYGQIGADVCRQIVDGLGDALPGTVFVFAGWNEVLPQFAEELLRTGKEYPVHLVGYEYAPPTLADERKRTLLGQIAKHCASLTLWVLDESFDTDALQIPGMRVRTMPDPIPHADDSPAMRQARAARSAFVDNNVAPQQTSFLAVGLQSARKGLRDIIRAARIVREQQLPLRVLLSGRVAPGEENLSPQVATLSEVIAVRAEYVSDEEILATYQNCDAVLLPYAADFSGSSGVFAHAMAFGKPVIATDHGCVGWRVRQFGVGLTYKANDVEGLIRSLRTMLGWTPAEWEECRRRCGEYYRRNSYVATLALIRREIRDIYGRRRLNGMESFRAKSDPAPSAVEEVSPRQSAAAAGDPYSFGLNTVESIRQIALLDTGIGSRNMGDHIIVDSIKRQLRDVFPAAIFVNVPTHEYLGPESLKLLDSCEIRLVCGTNLLASHMDEYKQWKLGGLEFAALRDVTLLGCGWWQYQEAPNPYTELLLNRILSNRTVHSVRDSYSVEKLRGLQSKSVINTTCPTLWSLTPAHLQGVPDRKARDVVTTLTDYKADPVADGFMLEHLAQRYRTVYVWIQGTGDFKYLKRLVPTGQDRIRVVPATLEAYDRLLTSSLDLDYVGTRLHAGVRALQKKRRALILAVDNRAREISADTALPCLPRERATAELEGMIEGISARGIRLPVEQINQWLAQFR